MLLAIGFTLITLHYVSSAGIPHVEPEFLNLLRVTGQDELFAKYVGIQDVTLLRPQEERSEDIIFTKVSPLGDILLTQEQEEEARQHINFKKYPANKWPNVIPYDIASGDFTRRQISTIESAIRTLNNSLSNLKIHKRTSADKDYVMIINGRGCYSYLGRTGGQQVLSLQSSGCLRTGTIQHEFIHAAGVMHEHCRPDRDNTVEVLFENIPEDWHSQYEKTSTKDFHSMKTYDHESVMHYPMSAPGTGKPAFRFHDSSVDTNKVGQRSGPTPNDIAKLDQLYSD